MRKVIVVAVLLLVDLKKKVKKHINMYKIISDKYICFLPSYVFDATFTAAAADDDVAVAVCRKFSAREHTVLAIATYTYARDLISRKI